ncbi:MAG: MATE family efflux transporter [Faecalibacterium sp.]
MTKDMTTGAITPLLVKFTVPLILGNLFQLTYNAVDSIIVGRFVGEDALAAVGTSNPLMTLAILFINGMCLGAGILVSTAFGAGDTDRVERQVSTTALAGAGFALAFSAFCVLLATPLLRLMQVPESLLPIAVSYLRIVFGGLIFTFFYNFLAATLRALGDSQSALYFLMVSALLNIGGDLFFVKAMGWGAAGCALSTVLSEALCCVLCIAYIQRKVPALQLGRKWLVFDSSLLRQTVSYGWASAMQQATVQLGKIAVQAIVNTMGVSAMAAFTAASRIDDFAYTPQQNIGHAMTTLMAQNRGAGKQERVRRGFYAGMRLEFGYALALTVVCFVWAGPIIRMFASDPEVVALGVRFLRLISILYCMPAATNGIQGFFRGLGDLKITLRSSTLNMVGRVAAAAVFVLLLHLDIEALPWSYAVGWLLMLLYELPPLFRMLRQKDLWEK